VWNYTFTPNTPSWRGVQPKHRDNFTLPKVTMITSGEKEAVVADLEVISQHSRRKIK
jgi:hypothetical protein